MKTPLEALRIAFENEDKQEFEKALAVVTEMYEKSREGWISNYGFRPNIPDDIRVEVRLRDGDTTVGSIYSFNWDLGVDPDSGDILEYKYVV